MLERKKEGTAVTYKRKACYINARFVPRIDFTRRLFLTQDRGIIATIRPRLINLPRIHRHYTRFIQLLLNVNSFSQPANIVISFKRACYSTTENLHRILRHTVQVNRYVS